jgi:hypothetical protein
MNEFFGLILSLVLIVLAIAWLVFPFIVIQKFNELLKETRRSRACLEAMRKPITADLQARIDDAQKNFEAREPARETLKT